MTLGADDGNFVVHARAVEDWRNAIRRAGRREAWVGGDRLMSGSISGVAFAPETAYLRITRAGAQVKFAASADGEKWTQFAGQEVNYPAKLTLGLFVANPSGEPFAAEFDQFTVRPLKDGK
jgi:hypothetical protein